MFYPSQHLEAPLRYVSINIVYCCVKHVFLFIVILANPLGMIDVSGEGVCQWVLIKSLSIAFNVRILVDIKRYSMSFPTSPSNIKLTASR